MGTIEDEGPVIVKVYLSKENNRSEELAKELESYKKTFENMREVLDIHSHPNVMPYQGLILDYVILIYMK